MSDDDQTVRLDARRLPIFPDQVSFHYKDRVPLFHRARKCAEFLSQVRTNPRSLPLSSDLIFRKEYASAAQTKFMGDGDMNGVVELYDTSLKASIAESEELRKKLAAKKGLLKRKRARWEQASEEMSAKLEAEKKRADEATNDLAATCTKVASLEREAAMLRSTAKAKADEYNRELSRLRKSRVVEVTRERRKTETAMIGKCNRLLDGIRDYEARRDKFDTARLLQSQAFGTKNCLETLKTGGSDIPQSTIDMFKEKEKLYEDKARDLDVGEITEEMLTLSPLVLPSHFVDGELLKSLDQFGSNAGFMSVEAIASLRTPNAPNETVLGDPAVEKEGPPAGVEGPIVPLSSGSSSEDLNDRSGSAGEGGGGEALIPDASASSSADLTGKEVIPSEVDANEAAELGVFREGSHDDV